MQILSKINVNDHTKIDESIKSNMKSTNGLTKFETKAMVIPIVTKGQQQEVRVYRNFLPKTQYPKEQT